MSINTFINPTEIPINNADLEATKDFLTQYIRDAGYDVSIEEGTAAHDVLIKVYSLIYNLFKYDVERAKAYLSLSNATAIKDTLGAEYDVAVDAVLSNWFVTRKEGIKTTGTLRLVFSDLPELVILNEGVVIGVLGTVVVAPLHTYELVATSFNIRTNIQNHSAEYYTDIEVGSIIDTAELITPKSTVKLFLPDINILKGEVINDFIPGKLKESSEDFIARTDEVITTRELISDRAIRTVLLDEYINLKAVYVAGHGDTEQLRDIVRFDDIGIHVGNKADIYLDAPIQKATANAVLEMDGSSEYIKVIPIANMYVIDIISVSSVIPEDVDDVTPVNYDYTISVVDEFTLGSPEFNLTVNITSDLQEIEGVENPNVVIVYLTSGTIIDVDQYVRLTTERVMAYNPRIKSKFPVILDITLNIDLLRDTARLDIPSDETLISDLKAVITKYTNNIPDKEPFIWSELIAEAHNSSVYILKVLTSSNISFTLRNPLTLEIVEGDIIDKFSLDLITGHELSEQLSVNTVRFYTDSDMITINVDN